jgi:hypothetical protein
MTKQNDKAIKTLLIVCSIIFVGSLIMLALTINESIKDREDANDFCNSINMTYSYEGYQACYMEDSSTRYISKIIRSDDGYRLLKSGERL